MAHYVDYIFFKSREETTIVRHGLPRILYPPGVVNTGQWFRLRTGNWHLVPAIVKKHENGLDLLPVRYTEVLTNSLFKSCGILFPGNTVEVNPHSIKANIVCPAKFLTNCCRIKSCCLPHLQLVDRRTRQEVCSC